MVKGPCWLSWIPATSDVYHKASFRLWNTIELCSERHKPFDVLISTHIAIFFLTAQCERWRSHNQVNAIVRYFAKILMCITQVSDTTIGFVEIWALCKGKNLIAH